MPTHISTHKLVIFNFLLALHCLYYCFVRLIWVFSHVHYIGDDGLPPYVWLHQMHQTISRWNFTINQAVCFYSLFCVFDCEHATHGWCMLRSYLCSHLDLLCTYTTIAMIGVRAVGLCWTDDGTTSLWHLDKQAVCLHQYGFIFAFWRVYRLRSILTSNSFFDFLSTDWLRWRRSACVCLRCIDDKI